MKKLLLIVLSVMAFAGMSVAQDIYSAGYYENSSGYQSAGVYKNGSKIYQCEGTSSNSYISRDVVYHNGDVYWVENSLNSDDTYNWGDVMKNDTRYLSNTVGNGSHIYALYHGNNLWSAGCVKIDGVTTAVAWKNNSSTPFYTLGSGNYKSYAYDVTVDTNGDVYICGVQYTSSTNYTGKVWKNGYELYDLGASFTPWSIAVYNGYVYVAGSTHVGGGDYIARVYQNDQVLHTLSNDDSRALGVAVEGYDTYACGWDGSYIKVWKNGQTLYSQASSGTFNIRAITVNSKGVYYAGCTNSNTGKIWKDGSVLYTPNSCDYIYGMYIAEPECEDSEIRTLPFTDGFENGETDWPCWTKLDVDDNNGKYASYWHRGGTHPFNNSFAPATGENCAYHRYGDVSPYNQEGWLISPRLFLQPGRDNTTLTFKSCMPRSSYYMPEGCSVWVSTTGTSTSNFTRVWYAEEASSSWQTIAVDLSDYQGQAVYIGFKYTSASGQNHCWIIDDVSVTESWASCSAQNLPYSYNFNNWDTHGTCFYLLDNDHSGDQRCWKYYSDDQCAYHPWGQTGVPQEGWMITHKINLPAGNHNYTLGFRTKSTSNGTGRKNTVWIALDKTGTPNISDYTTKIWEDASYSSSWTDVEVDLTPYKGHIVNIAFKYEGNYAHNWFVDDITVEESTVQYTITANANNNAWGTVSGGGVYNSGETCTLHATPASGYQFDSWKKNGSVVSTSPNYSFTVTENATYTAYFSEEPVTYYTITTNVTPAGAGSVSGAGTYPEGSSVTLTASANNGYTFSQWQDGNTQNPRTITVTGNATYTASFTQNQYTINVYANPTNGGTVTGGGSYHYGDNVTLTATPASGFEWAGWQDGNTDNPRTITVIGNANYTAYFNEVGTTYYTVTTSVSPDDAGTVTGGGTYEVGTNVVLTATANAGYTFDHWNDGSTANPRSITVNSNMSFTAYFTRNQYTITVVADPSNAGTVGGGGSYYYGDIATLTATAFSGYDFAGWSDGSMENPHPVTVTGNATYTATFSQGGSTYYTVSAYVSPSGAGTVTGTGTFPAGATTTLTASANSGYVFDHWNDGSTTNPRTVTVNNNMSFTAYFVANEYTITVNANPSNGGTVSGGGTYSYGDVATLIATPNTNYEFMQWSDGNTQNPRTIVVTQNATYTALFVTQGGEVFTLTVTSAQPLLGSVFGGGTYPAGAEVQIEAFPHTYAHFVQWNDGNTQNPRTVIVNSDMEFSAEFVASQHYTITVESANPEMGQAFGSGTYNEGEQVQIAAVAFDGYMFMRWEDGNTQNPRTITVTSNATYRATFAESSVTTHTLTLLCNTEEGSVSGGGVYQHGATAGIAAFPNQGYLFEKWSDGNTQNPRQIVVNEDITLTAIFKYTSVDENDDNSLVVFPNPARESIRIVGLESNSTLEIYNSIGELVKVVNAGPEQEIGIRDLASGLYMIRCGSATLRFVKQQ